MQFRFTTKLVWIDSSSLENLDEGQAKERLAGLDAIIVPQGWGSRGTEGKIKAAQFARENNVPYLGLCFGMQMATVEFARNVLWMKGANSEEINPKTKFPVIHIMPHQKEYLAKKQYGGTIRLGAWPCILKKGTKLYGAYKKFGQKGSGRWYESNPLTKGSTLRRANIDLIFERHRHRYEFNNKYKVKFEKEGFVISGTSPDGKLVEAIEIKNHPFFVGTQFHPEYLSSPLAPHPIFVSFIESVVKQKSG